MRLADWILPFDTQHPEVMTGLSYFPQKLITDADYEAFSQMIIGKFGEPYYGGTFCTRGIPNIALENNEWKVVDWLCDWGSPTLRLDGYSTITATRGHQKIFALRLFDGEQLSLAEHDRWEKQRKVALPQI